MRSGSGQAAAPSWRLLPLILGLAFAARVAVVLAGDFIYHPDVVFQYLEPAWRLVSGQGLVMWEQYYGARSQLVPTALAGVMDALRALGVDHPTTLRTGVEVVLCGVSLLIPWGMYAFARAVFDERVGRVALLLGAGWYEFVALAGQPLSETLALCPLLWTFALAADTRTSRRAAALGLLVVLTSALRIQYAPVAVLGAGYAFVAMDPSLRWRCLQAATVALGLVALFDLATVGSPLLRSYVANFVFNLAFSEEARRLGLDGRWYFHLLALLVASGGLLLVAPTALLGLKRGLGGSWGAYGLRSIKWLWLPLVLAMALHAVVPWKEYRHVFIAVPLWLTAVATVICWLWSRPGAAGRGMGVLLTAGFVTVALLGVQVRLPAQAALYGPFRLVPLSFLGPPDPRLAFADRLAGNASLTGLAEVRFGPAQGLGHVHLATATSTSPVSIYDGVSVASLAACGWEPEDYASHVIVEPNSPVPGGFEVTARDAGGWRLAERVAAGDSPFGFDPGPVRVLGPFGSLARRAVFEADGDRPRYVRLWEWWEGRDADGLGPLAPFRAHGGGKRQAPRFSEWLGPKCGGGGTGRR